MSFKILKNQVTITLKHLVKLTETRDGGQRSSRVLLEEDGLTEDGGGQRGGRTASLDLCKHRFICTNGL